MGGMSSAEAVEPSRGVGDDGGDSDKRGARSIRVGRWDVSAGEDEEDEVGIEDKYGTGGGVDKEGEEKKGVDSMNMTLAETKYLRWSGK